jgi:hypothetical protein
VVHHARQEMESAVVGASACARPDATGRPSARDCVKKPLPRRGEPRPGRPRRVDKWAAVVQPNPPLGVGQLAFLRDLPHLGASFDVLPRPLTITVWNYPYGGQVLVSCVLLLFRRSRRATTSYGLFLRPSVVTRALNTVGLEPTLARPGYGAAPRDSSWSCSATPAPARPGKHPHKCQGITGEGFIDDV